MKPCLCLVALFLAACGKEAPQPEPKAKAEKAAATKPLPEKKLPPVPQGALPKMDPQKAKFIAVPSTPKDPGVKKVGSAADKPKTEIKKEVQKPAADTAKTAPAATAKPAEPPAAEIKKAAPIASPTKPAEAQIKKAEVPGAKQQGTL